jgi:hypothetical protein
MAIGVAALPLVPPPHVHEIEAAGHHDRLVHSHSEAHHVRAHAIGAVFDDRDTVVLTLDPVFALLHSAPALPAPALVQLIVEPPPGESLASTAFVEPRIHGPPRAPTALRGPPSSPLL